MRKIVVLSMILAMVFTMSSLMIPKVWAGYFHFIVSLPTGERLAEVPISFNGRTVLTNENGEAFSGFVHGGYFIEAGGTSVRIAGTATWVDVGLYKAWAGIWDPWYIWNYHITLHPISTHKVAYVPVVYADTSPEIFRDFSIVGTLTGLVKEYYQIQSYGEVVMASDILFNEWEFLGKSFTEYDSPPFEPSFPFWPSSLWQEKWLEIADDAIELSGINEEDYDAIVVIQPTFIREFVENVAGQPGKKVIVDWDDGYRSIAHELGHALFKFADYYSESGSLGWILPWLRGGDIKRWGLMGGGSELNPPAPVTSWNKIQADWLKKEYVSIGEHELELLHEKDSGSDVFFFTQPWVGYEYIFEGRDLPDESVLVPVDPLPPAVEPLPENKGILLYKVHKFPLFSKVFAVPFVGDDFRTPTLLPDGPTYFDDLLFAKFSAIERDSKMYLKIEEHSVIDRIVVVLQNLEFELPEMMSFSSPPLQSSQTFDIDLHAYTYDGHTVGMNYMTGVYELDVQGARSSGNIPGCGPEWISLPGSSGTIYFTVDPTPARKFAEQHDLPVSDIQATLQLLYYDSSGDVWESELVSSAVQLEETTLIRCAIIPNPDGTYTPVLDNIPPLLTVIVPSENAALQDGVTLSASASDENGVSSVTFSIREPNGDQGTIISPDFEYMSASPTTDDVWELPFDTILLPDGYYLGYIEATDVAGNIVSDVVPFSIRNWATIELLPTSESNKAGRTMPVKFSLRVVESVDPAQPFVYNEELTIIIYEEGHPEDILQESTYGDTVQDYRISSENELYITNFKTLRGEPATYVVEIYRKGMLIGSFTFETVK